MQDPGPSSSYYSAFPDTADGPVRPPSPPSSPRLNGSTLAGPSTDETLYAILNLPRNASEAEIRDRYRSLASTFHPDRQRDDAARRAAHGRFQEIQRAYEVLTDPTKRMIYDMFGEEGLRTSWEVGHRVKTPAELRKHFEKQSNAKRQLEIDALVKSRGDMTVVFDARAVFLPKSVFPHPERLKHDAISRIQRTRPGRIAMKHSFEVPLSERTQFICAGQMIARNGQGGANVVGTIKHQFSPRLWIEVGTGLLPPRALNMKGTYTVDENTYVTVNAVAQTLAAPPRMSISLGRRIYAQTTGFITYKSGFFNLGSWGLSLPPQLALSDRSGLSVGATTANRDGTGWTVETQAGLNDSHISADWSTRILGVRVKLGVAGGSSDGINAFVDAESKVSNTTRVGYMVQAEFAGGITARIRFARLGQRIAIPIVLAPNVNPYVLFGFTFVPAAGYAVLHHFYLSPRRRRRIKERVQELREENAEMIAQKKMEAHEAVQVMERPTALKLAAEQEKRGLIIISAHYGLASAFTERGRRETGGAEDIIDVTVPVQALVNDSRLIIPGGRGKHALLGFWDPCIGERKKLRIRYSFRDTLHEVTVDDTAAVRAPLKEHLLDSGR
ncbi:hypothetical protein BD324DRAFT_599616 [Kockovaella imperatae]|uniref:J domain-containing protein n=1 Tax=Kockovaella imperatae TaxID=4999 RepID=A0A1Y1UL01_9TREE|nr:hypothetical protein BD324DRAFT_599616 [Kockovaella imperatae]ORX38669.1 hypothetical protein BD324DRAFT_599616 [Kockovaella imperatae]